MTFELKLNDEVYYPSKTNDILSIVSVRIKIEIKRTFFKINTLA